MTIGVKRTLSILGVTAVMVSHPLVYWAAKCAGAAYLIHVGLRLWAANASAVAAGSQFTIEADTFRSLLLQGFVAAVANPKAWILYASLFPPFLDSSRRMAPQIPAVLSLMLAIEFGCLLLYATGGRVLMASQRIWFPSLSIRA